MLQCLNDTTTKLEGCLEVLPSGASLRRHYPDQVQRVSCDSRTLSRSVRLPGQPHYGVFKSGVKTSEQSHANNLEPASWSLPHTHHYWAFFSFIRK